MELYTCQKGWHYELIDVMAMERYRSTFLLVFLLLLGVNAMADPMEEARTHPSVHALGVFHDEISAELFTVSADRRTGELVSSEFFETRPDLAEIELLKRVPWEYRVSRSATIFAPHAGLTRDDLGIFWIAWLANGRYQALSLFQESPVSFGVGAEVLIFPPVIGPSKTLNQFSWKTNNDESVLVRHRFGGGLGESASHAPNPTATAIGRPVLSIAAPVPAATVDGLRVAAVVDTAAGPRVVVVALDGDAIETLASNPLRESVPLPTQRPGIHVDLNGRTTLGMVSAHRLDGKALLTEVICDFKNKTCDVAERNLSIPASEIRNGAVTYFRFPEQAKAFVTYALKNNRLEMSDVETRRVLRLNTDPSYDFPIVTSHGGRYEAWFGQDGQIELRGLD